MSEIKKYCEGIDCSWCNEKEPCIYKIANELEDKLTAKEQAEQKLVNQIQTICDFINNRPETFKGINGSVDKIITDYAERKEQECEELKLDLIEAKAHGDYLNNLALSETLNLVSEQLDQLKSELKSAKELREYTYDCCKQAGEELAKNSFEWDGKEKNLVVQAMELNERYDQLKVENGGLKKNVMLKCPQCGEIYLSPIGCELYDENADLKAENGELKETINGLLKVQYQLADSCKKYAQERTEIREIAESCYDPVDKDNDGFWTILQKIREMENGK